MPTLNRFPLLGLWAKEAARRLGYARDEAEALGHAYAVLYAIRKQKVSKPEGTPKEKEPARKPRKARHLRFGGDELEVVYDADGKVRGRVGGDKPQTPRTYEASVRKKFPPGYYAKLEHAFRTLFKRFEPDTLEGRLVYNLYDEWKKACAVGRFVDLDELLRWCRARAKDAL